MKHKTRSIIKIKNTKYFLISIILLFVFCFVGKADAAKIYFDSPSVEAVSIGMVVPVEVRLDTKGEEINAVEVRVNFDGDIFEVTDFSDGGSVLSFWVQKPKAENGSVSFSGLVPGGFYGDGRLLKIFLKAVKEGRGEISGDKNSSILLNDGKGTRADLEISKLEFLISKQINETRPPAEAGSPDIVPPEKFSPQVGKYPDGQWFIAFATQDKDSGMDRYEVKEEKFLGKSEWVVAQSPYLLKDQGLKSRIYVKAVDNEGNERMETVEPLSGFFAYYNYLFWGIIIILVLMAIFVFVIRKKFKILILLLFFVFFVFGSKTADAASLSFGPTSGSFVVGSTFEVSILLNTENEAVNTVAVSVGFPADKLQLVSPTTGQSIIDIWLTQPKFNNQTGFIDLKGGIPGGINVGNGLITKLTFRVKGVGQAVLKFLDGSTVLLNDGLGTEALRHTESAIYNLELPAPAGPIVVSPTHSEQSKWYPNPTAVLNWAGEEGASHYSYILNNEIVDTPDDISEGARTSVIFKNLGDGRHYFHIKALRNGIWGGTTHFAVNIDTSPPAEFPVEILPYQRTTRPQPAIQFSTTDVLSGLDHYELKIISLSTPVDEQGISKGEGISQEFFIEVQSPYVTPRLALGRYDVLVRAYDKAGNYRESTQRLEIASTIFRYIAVEGLEFDGRIIVSWFWFFLILVLVVIVLGGLAWYFRKWHREADRRKETKELPGHIDAQLQELKKYRQKYGNVIILFLALILWPLLFSHSALAEQLEFGPPIISTISRNISNNEIFYVGGKTEASDTEVTIYIQNLQTGETLSQKIISDKRGDWFYRHDTFLQSGAYLLWTQAKIGDQSSPPSPQLTITVRATVLQFGSSRISYETFYLVMAIFLLLVICGLMAYILFHLASGRKKHKQLRKEVKEAEEALKRGFVVLRRDIQAELAIVKRAKLSAQLSAEEKVKEEQLLKDLEDVERYIGKEMFDIEKAESIE